MITRRQKAIERARDACSALDTLGVKADVIGSLSRGEFTVSSDIDFLIRRCPRELKYGIEGIVEDCLAGFRFDVIYIDEVPSHKIDELTRDAVNAWDLR